jgi:carboxyl-terminal processing protease
MRRSLATHIRAGCGALLGLCAILVIAATPAQAEPRVALVIGNSAYKGDLPALPNPANDAKLMANTLKTVGFDVVEAEDADQTGMKKAIAEFGKKLAAAGSTATGLFFYAGHGLQVSGENYLIPVDAQIETEADVDLVSVSATTVLKQMDFAGSAVNIVILDACRNNPLSNGARGMTRGLAELKSTPRGSFIAYSTAPGSTAADGDGRNSPYTKALAETITEPGLSISDVFQEVRTKVLAATGQSQTPWDSSSLTGRFYFKPPAAGAPAQASTAVTPQAPAAPNDALTKLQIEQSWWEAAKQTNTAEAYAAYLKKYPNGAYVDVAQLKLQALKGTQTASAATAQDDGRTVQQPSRIAPQLAFVAQAATVYAKGGGQVRAAPDGKAALMQKLKTNTEVQATGVSEDGTWWRVALPDGRIGYMHATVVSSQPVQLANAAPASQPAPAPAQGQPANNGFVTQSAPTNAAPSNGGVQLVDTGQPVTAPVQSAPPVDTQALGQAAGALQGGSFGGALSSLLSGAAQQQQPTTTTAAPTQMAFTQINQMVTLRAGAILFDRPNGQPIKQLPQETQMMASGTSQSWMQVQMPDGALGYVAKNWLKR